MVLQALGSPQMRAGPFKKLAVLGTLDFWTLLRWLNTTETFGIRLRFSSKDGCDPVRNVSIGSCVWTLGSASQLV